MKLNDPLKLSQLQQQLLVILESHESVSVEQLATLFDITWDAQNVRMNMSNLRTKMRQMGDQRTVLFDRGAQAYRLVSFTK